MDDQRKSLILTAVVTLIILALIVGLVIYLVRFVQNRQRGQVASNPSPPARVIPSASGNPGASILPAASNVPVRSSAPLAVASNPPANTGNGTLYSGQGFKVRYPSNWGILTCSNSLNFEFDPTNGADQIKVACERALKPVTILVGTNANCTGDTVSLGNIKVVKAKNSVNGRSTTRWCTQTNPTLDITHRVSQTPQRATSTQDFSAQIEQMISTYSN